MSGAVLVTVLFFFKVDICAFLFMLNHFTLSTLNMTLLYSTVCKIGKLLSAPVICANIIQGDKLHLLDKNSISIIENKDTLALLLSFRYYLVII